MAQSFRVPGPLGTSPNDSRHQIPDPLKISAGDVFWGAIRWTNPMTFTSKLIQTVTGFEPDKWSVAEGVVRLSADKIAIPPGHVTALKRYANANPDDGEVLNDALDEDPSFYTGGWLLSVVSSAKAITLGKSI